MHEAWCLCALGRWLSGQSNALLTLSGHRAGLKSLRGRVRSALRHGGGVGCVRNALCHGGGGACATPCVTGRGMCATRCVRGARGVVRKTPCVTGRACA